MKTYLLKSKLNKGLIYGAWEENGYWVYLDRGGAKVYITKELYEISSEWNIKPRNMKTKDIINWTIAVFITVAFLSVML